MKRFLGLSTRGRIVAVVVAIAVIVVLYWVFAGNGDTPAYQTAIAEKKDVVEEVSVTGQVVPVTRIDLGFERAGRISSVPVSVGTRVSRGQTLAALDAGGVASDLRQAEANLRVEQAKLTELLRGTRPEEIEISRVKFASASSTLAESQRSALNTINDSYAKAEDAIHNLTDQLFSNPRTSNPALTILVAYQLDNMIESQRTGVEPILSSWQNMLIEMAGAKDARSYITKSKTNLTVMRDYLSTLALGVNSLEPSASLTKATIDGYKTDTNTARTNINAAITSLTTADEKIRTAESAYLLAEEELRLLQAGSTPEKISAQRALVDSTQARVDSLSDELSKTSLRAPVGGIVVMQEARVGELATVGKVIIAIVGDAGYEVEAYIPEVDIGGVDVGDNATLTLDAFGEDMEFTATVSTIDPAETIREGVPTYKVTLLFEDGENRVKSGMTANVDILSNKATGVVAIPQRAVIRKEGRKFVRIPSGDTYTEVEVVTGLRGSDGSIEIVSGITEGQVVITFLEE